VRRRRVFIDSTFVEVLLDRSDERHDSARTAFEQLLVEFERGTTVLYSHEAVVSTVGHGRADEVLRVCEVVTLRRWLTRAAEHVDRVHPELGRCAATTLVLMRRWRIGEIASFDPFFEQHAIPTIPVSMVGRR